MTLGEIYEISRQMSEREWERLYPRYEPETFGPTSQTFEQITERETF